MYAWSWYGVPRAPLKVPLANALLRAAWKSLVLAVVTMERPQVADSAAVGQVDPALASTAPDAAPAKQVAAATVLDCRSAVAGSAVAKGVVADPACATGGHAGDALGPALGLAPMWAAAGLAMGLLAGSAPAKSPAVAPALACLAFHAS